MIVNYIPNKDFGFIKCEDVGGEDVYFHKTLVPSEQRGDDLGGRSVEFELQQRNDGKLRAEHVWLLDTARGASNRKGGGKGKDRGRRSRSRRQKKERDVNAPPPPPLGDDKVSEMRLCLEERGGVMDFGRFSNKFQGLKKVQIEAHFNVEPDDPKRRKHWQITLPGVEKMDREELERRDREVFEALNGNSAGPRPTGDDQSEYDLRGDAVDEDAEVVEQDAECEADLHLQPSFAFRMFGWVQRWDHQSGSGTISTDGLGELALQRESLPHEVQNWRGDLERVEITFDLDDKSGDPNAINVQVLLEPDENGGWRMRRRT